MLGVCTATALASRPSPPGPPSFASIVKMQLGDLARRPGPPAQAVVLAGRIWSSRTSVPQPNPDRVRKSAEHCGLRTLTRSMPSCVTQIVIAVLVLYLAPAPVLPGIAPDFFLALSLLAWKLQHFPWEFLEGRVAWMRLRRYRPPRPVERRLARSVRASRPFGSLRPGPKARTDRLFTFYSTGNAHGHSYRIHHTRWTSLGIALLYWPAQRINWMWLCQSALACAAGFWSLTCDEDRPRCDTTRQGNGVRSFCAWR